LTWCSYGDWQFPPYYMCLINFDVVMRLAQNGIRSYGHVQKEPIQYIQFCICFPRALILITFCTIQRLRMHGICLHAPTHSLECISVVLKQRPGSTVRNLVVTDRPTKAYRWIPPSVVQPTDTFTVLIPEGANWTFSGAPSPKFCMRSSSPPS
jgi:hypothetical protein